MSDSELLKHQRAFIPYSRDQLAYSNRVILLLNSVSVLGPGPDSYELEMCNHILDTVGQPYQVFYTDILYTVLLQENITFWTLPYLHSQMQSAHWAVDVTAQVVLC